MSRSTTTKGLVLVAAISLSMAACTSSSSTPSSSGSSGSSAKQTPLVIEDNPVATFTNDFNPFDSTSASSTENTNSLVYEPLFQFNTLNSTEAPIPWLATAYAWSNGNKTLTLTLRSNVKWSDGQAFTSADVDFTFGMLQSQPATNTGGVPATTSITTPSPTSVVLNFASPESANFEAIGSQLIVPQHLWSSVAKPATAVISGPNAIGTGPYLVNKFGAQDITYKTNPSYWGGAPKVAAISLPAYAGNDAATLALASGDIDLTGNDINNVQSVFVAKDPSTNHLFQTTAPYFPAGNTVSLLLNNKDTNAPALGDATVRAAISAALDRSSMASQCETNYENPATSAGGLTLPIDQNALDPAEANDLKSGPDDATVTSLMTGDGYAKVGGKWTKGGQQVKFTIIDPNTFTDYWCDAQAMVGELNNEGFNVTDNGAFTYNSWNTAITTGDFDAALHWGQGNTPFQRLQFILDPSTTAAIGSVAAEDFDRYSSPAATAAVSAYENATTPADEQTALNSLQALFAKDMPAVPVLYGASWYEYSTANFTGWPTSTNAFINPSPNSQAYEYMILKLSPVS
ncbi:MAG TPA: ABC transporter substrate-binding protein [Actinocrinis sp.]|nr:ABC transporter substrate-binding protein [Actinocrinis sp.]